MCIVAFQCTPLTKYLSSSHASQGTLVRPVVSVKSSKGPQSRENEDTGAGAEFTWRTNLARIGLEIIVESYEGGILREIEKLG